VNEALCRTTKGGACVPPEAHPKSLASDRSALHVGTFGAGSGHVVGNSEHGFGSAVKFKVTAAPLAPVSTAPEPVLVVES